MCPITYPRNGRRSDFSWGSEPSYVALTWITRASFFPGMVKGLHDSSDGRLSLISADSCGSKGETLKKSRDLLFLTSKRNKDVDYV